jgi:tetratricopeptide (TPR) repeat protein
MDLRLFLAFDQDKLLPLDEMDRGFTRPTYPGQILLSYYHASKIIGYIVDAHGFEAVVDLLHAFASGLNTEAALETELGQSTDVLDQAFRTRLQAERVALAQVLAGLPNPFVEEEAAPPTLLERVQGADENAMLAALREGNEHLRAAEYEAAEASFRRALDLYDRFAEPGNAYQGLAAVYRAQGDTAKLEDILVRFIEVSEHGVAETRELAALRLAAGDEEGAQRYLERSLEIDPYDRTVYDELAGLYASHEQFDDAVQARNAILALNPVDRSAAYYRLALSLEQAGRIVEARRATLEALELAPGYREAQRLLLKLVDAAEG